MVRWGLLLATTLTLACCAAPGTPQRTKTTAASPSPVTTPTATPASPTPTPIPLVAPTPSASPSALIATGIQTSPTPAVYFARVLDLTGQPAKGVEVRGYVISNGGASVISNNSGSYRLQATDLTTRTDDKGEFKLVSPDGQPLNLEATQADNVKAFAPAVASTTTGLTLQLAPTGSIRGKVLPPLDSGITDLQGIDVYVPGTSYTAKCDQAGNYVLSNMPAGSFEIVAAKSGVGEGRLAAVTVASSKETSPSELTLVTKVPMITSFTPSYVDGAKGGDEVTIKGRNFGHSSGAPFQVSVGGLVMADVKRNSDEEIVFKLDPLPTAQQMVITVDNVRSASKTLPIIKAIKLVMPFFGFQAGEEVSFEVGGTLIDGTNIPGSEIKIELSGDVFQLDRPAAKIKALKNGTSMLKLSLGNALAQRELTVTNNPSVRWLESANLLDKPPAALPQPVKVDGAYNVALAPDGSVLLAAPKLHMIFVVGPDKTLARFAGRGLASSMTGPALSASFIGPSGLAYDSKGNLYIADSDAHKVMKLGTDGNVSLFAGSGASGSQDGAGAAATFVHPNMLAIDKSDNLYVADALANKIRKIDPLGNVTTLAGTGETGLKNGPADQAMFNLPIGVTVDPSGNVFVSDGGNHVVRKITPAGEVSTFCGTGENALKDGEAGVAAFRQPTGILALSTGELFVADGNGHIIRFVKRDGTVISIAGTSEVGVINDIGARATFNQPVGLAVDEARRRLYVAEMGSGDYRVVAY